MPYFLRLSALVIGVALYAAAQASAADLNARPSRIGAIFDDEQPRAGRSYPVERPLPQGVLYTNALKVPGYYGTPHDFDYRNYYGTSPLTIYSRLPYACGLVGLC